MLLLRIFSHNMIVNKTITNHKFPLALRNDELTSNIPEDLVLLSVFLPFITVVLYVMNEPLSAPRLSEIYTLSTVQEFVAWTDCGWSSWGGGGGGR